MICIEEAIVPLITFDYEEINIDLQIAILPLVSIPDNLNILYYIDWSGWSNGEEFEWTTSDGIND